MLLLDYASVNTPSAVDAHRRSRPFLCGNSRQVLPVDAERMGGCSHGWHGLLMKSLAICAFSSRLTREEIVGLLNAPEAP